MARQILDRLKALLSRGAAVSLPMGCVYEGLGDLDPAWVWLEGGVESRDTDPHIFRIHPCFRDPIKDPRSAALLRKCGLHQ